MGHSPKESGHGTVYIIMERSAIQGTHAEITYVRATVGHVGRHQSLGNIRFHHVWLFSSADVDARELWIPDDLANHEEVVLSVVSCTLTLPSGEFCKRIRGCLQRFVHAKTIDVEHSNLHARHDLDLIEDVTAPFP